MGERKMHRMLRPPKTIFPMRRMGKRKIRRIQNMVPNRDGRRINRIPKKNGAWKYWLPFIFLIHFTSPCPNRGITFYVLVSWSSCWIISSSMIHPSWGRRPWQTNFYFLDLLLAWSMWNFKPGCARFISLMDVFVVVGIQHDLNFRYRHVSISFHNSSPQVCTTRNNL